jgi:predicted ATPase
MRLAISGTANTGKSTLLKAFLQRWPMYGTPLKTYRDVITENDLEHSSKTTEETQLLILDWMMTTQEKFKKEDNIIFDRCSWDNLAYTLVGNANDKINNEVTAASISLVRESLKNIDIIFWLRHDEDIAIVDDGLRDVSKNHILEVDDVFAQLYDQYADDLETDIFYPKEDCPAIIEIHGKTVDDRISFISNFIDDKGELIEPDENFFSEENLQVLEQMLKDQEKAQKDDEAIVKLTNDIKNGKSNKR